MPQPVDFSALNAIADGSIIPAATLESLATTNNFLFEATVNNPVIYPPANGYAAGLMNLYMTVNIVNRISSQLGSTPSFEIGTVTKRKYFSLLTTKNSYVAIHLSGPMIKHATLDYKQMTATLFGVTIGGAGLHRSQDHVVEIGGRFDTVYSLQAPIDDEQTIRNIFTPALVDLLLQDAYEAQINDNVLCIILSSQSAYASFSVGPLGAGIKKSTLERFFSIVNAF